MFARSPPLPISLWGCTDLTGASEFFGDKTALFGPRDAFLSHISGQLCPTTAVPKKPSQQEGGDGHVGAQLSKLHIWVKTHFSTL